jgi:hypothetical protein
MEQAFTTHDEEALTVARVFLSQSLAEAELSVVTGDGGTTEDMQIGEEKVFVQLGRLEENRDAKVWILDIGATNHMTGSLVAFVGLDMRMRGTVRFGDDSAIEIEGCGRVEFVCKTGELRTLDAFYYIP